MLASSLLTQAAALAAILTLAAVTFGPLGAHLGWLTPIIGFGLFVAGLVLGGSSSLILGLVALVRTRGVGTPGMVWLALGVGVAAVLGLGVFIATLARVPRIHDITTSPTEATELQRRAYPDVVPIELPVPAERAFEAARQAVETLGWTLVRSDAQLGIVEAYEQTPVFRFVDDVAIRVRAAGEGSVIDVRSTSRVGQSDLGANAARIRRFAARVRATAR